MRSFRARIALFNGAVSVILLLVMGAVILFSQYRMEMGKIERNLVAFGERGVPRLSHVGAYQEFGDRLTRSLPRRSDSPTEWILMGMGGVIFYKSPGWPEAIPPESLSTERVTEALIRLQGPPVPPSRPGPPPERLQLDGFEILRGPETSYYVGKFSSKRAALAVTADLGPMLGRMRSTGLAILVALPFLLALVVPASLWISGKATRPIRDLTRSIDNVTDRSLDERVRLVGADKEFTRLAETYNAMLDRLQRSFHQARRFSNDAAHELKTPLTVLQGELEAALADSEEGSVAQQRLSTLAIEVQTLRQIISKLLLLSQADAGKLSLSPATVDISMVIHEMLSDFAAMHPGIHFEEDCSQGITVPADPVLIGQLLHNLLDNATKYNRQEGFVRIRLARQPEKVVIEVTNSGEPIPQEARERIFDRFVRANSNSAHGTGLGLSLAREFAETHGGALDLIRNEPDHITFRLILPAGGPPALRPPLP